MHPGARRRAVGDAPDSAASSRRFGQAAPAARAAPEIAIAAAGRSGTSSWRCRISPPTPALCPASPRRCAARRCRLSARSTRVSDRRQRRVVVAYWRRDALARAAPRRRPPLSIFVPPRSTPIDGSRIGARAAGARFEPGQRVAVHARREPAHLCVVAVQPVDFVGAQQRTIDAARVDRAQRQRLEGENRRRRRSGGHVQTRFSMRTPHWPTRYSPGSIDVIMPGSIAMAGSAIARVPIDCGPSCTLRSSRRRGRLPWRSPGPGPSGARARSRRASAIACRAKARCG